MKQLTPAQYWALPYIQYGKRKFTPQEWYDYCNLNNYRTESDIPYEPQRHWLVEALIQLAKLVFWIVLYLALGLLAIIYGICISKGGKSYHQHSWHPRIVMRNKGLKYS